MSADLLRQAAALMRERVDLATPRPWRADDLGRVQDDMGYTIAQTPDPGDAVFIAAMSPAVALAVADWLEAVATVHWPKRHDRYSESHYNAEPEHDFLMGDCDESCYVEAYICNGCGTTTCKPEVTGGALAVARAYLQEATDV